jgi:hypothetical protein
VGGTMVIDHFHVNEHIENFVFGLGPLRGVFGG